MSETQNSIWGDGFIKIADLFTKDYCKSEGDEYLFKMADSPVKLGVFTEVYKILIRQKKIEPLESLSEEEKKGLYEEAKRISKNQDKKHLHSVCKTLHCLGQFMQL